MPGLVDTIKEIMLEAGRDDSNKALRAERDWKWEEGRTIAAEGTERIHEQEIRDHAPAALRDRALPESVGSVLAPDLRIQVAYDLAHSGNSGPPLPGKVDDNGMRAPSEGQIQQEIFNETPAYGSAEAEPGVGKGQISTTMGNIIPS